jgi:crossover junction endodeoxyribonuclease RusA
MRLTLPYPPSVNHYWKYGIRGVYLTEAGRAYRDNATAWAWKSCWGRPALIEGHVRVAVTTFAPDHRTRDLDNVLKATLDALKHIGVIVDDGLIDSLSVVRWAPDRENPRIEVEVESWEPLEGL